MKNRILSYMKKILLLFLIVVSSQIYSQEFAPIGAIWHYTQWTLNPELTSFKTIESISDTTINEIQCRKMIEVERVYDTIGTTYHYMYSENDSVFFFADNDFQLLYDFGAIAGDTIILEYFSTHDGSPLKMIIDSTGSIIINNDERKIQHITCGDGISLEFGNRIIDGIGNTGFMFPQGCVTQNGPLRCFQDSSTGLFLNPFHTTGGWNHQDCDQIFTGIEEVSSNDFVVYPNPVSKSLFIKNIYKPTEYRIIDLFGKILKKDRIGISGEIRVDDLLDGIYILELETENQLTIKKIIKN